MLDLTRLEQMLAPPQEQSRAMLVHQMRTTLDLPQAWTDEEVVAYVLKTYPSPEEDDC